MSPTPGAFDFRSRRPERPLGRLVASIWYARGQITYTRERIAPTGSSVAVFVLGDPILQTPNDGNGSTLRADRGFLIGPHVAHLSTSQALISGLDRCERAVAMLEHDPTRPIADIAAELGVSHGHLDRELGRVVGLSPRALARLLRMRRLLAGIDVRGEVDWAACAADLGWFDQPHLIRDFKRHTGVTPSHYLAAQRAAFSAEEAGDAVGFVPES